MFTVPLFVVMSVVIVALAVRLGMLRRSLKESKERVDALELAEVAKIVEAERLAAEAKEVAIRETECWRQRTMCGYNLAYEGAVHLGLAANALLAFKEVSAARVRDATALRAIKILGKGLAGYREAGFTPHGLERIIDALSSKVLADVIRYNPKDFAVVSQVVPEDLKNMLLQKAANVTPSSRAA